MKNRGGGAQLLLTRFPMLAVARFIIIFVGGLSQNATRSPPRRFLAKNALIEVFELSGRPFPRDHVLPRSLLRTNTSESTSSKISQEEEGLFRKARSTKRTGPYPGEVHPPGKRRASWKTMIPSSITCGCQSFQSCSTASS